MSLQPGSRPVPNYPDYILIRKLGAGAFGEVWHAHGPGGLDVALKFIPLDTRLRAVELRSLKLMSRIRHPNLVSLFGAWDKDNCLIVAMELCERTLQDRLAEALHQNRPGIPLEELLSYTSDAASGLDALHAKRVAHRDVKPANLLLLNSGVKVADYGLAKALEQTVASNSGAGTLAYTAPECFKGKLTQQSDQYSLAVTYYHLRTGQLLFKGNQAQITYAHLELEPELSDLPAAERVVLARALAKEPGKRWASCRVFVNELTDAHQQAKEKLRKANAVFYYNRGVARLDKKEYDNAIEEFNEAIRLDQRYASAYHNRGLAWSCKRDYEKAINDFNEAIRLDPKCMLAYYNRGLARSDKKDFDEAIKDFDEAIRFDPHHASAYLARGLVWSDKEEYANAIKDFDDAIRLDPRNSFAFISRALAWAHEKDYVKASYDYSEAIRLDPNNVEAHGRFAWLLGGCPNANVRDTERAIQLAMRACDLTDWKSGWQLATLAAVYAEAGQFDQAVHYVVKALDDPAYRGPAALRQLAHSSAFKNNTPSQQLLERKIEQLLRSLTNRERQIIRLHYGLFDEFTYGSSEKICNTTSEEQPLE